MAFFLILLIFFCFFFSSFLIFIKKKLGAFDLFEIPSDNIPSSLSSLNLYLPTSSQQNIQDDFNKVMSDFDNFDPFGDFSSNEEFDQLYSDVIPKGKTMCINILYIYMIFILFFFFNLFI